MYEFFVHLFLYLQTFWYFPHLVKVSELRGGHFLSLDNLLKNSARSIRKNTDDLCMCSYIVIFTRFHLLLNYLWCGRCGVSKGDSGGAHRAKSNKSEMCGIILREAFRKLGYQITYNVNLCHFVRLDDPQHLHPCVD